MKLELYEWLEADEELIVGPHAGSVWIEAGQIEIDVPDPELENRLLTLLDEPLWLRVSAGRQASGSRAVDPGDPDFVQALSERLARRDFRLHVVSS